jgi:hypothetical protein
MTIPNGVRTSTADWSRNQFGKRRNFADGNGATDGASEAVAEPVAWVFWGKPVLRLAVLSAGRKSGAGAGRFFATGEHTSAVESMPARNCSLRSLVAKVLRYDPIDHSPGLTAQMLKCPK